MSGMTPSLNLSTSEREFLCEDMAIFIIPHFRADQIHLISGDYGPFRPPTQVKVPLWLAISLRKGNHCTLVIPAWMDSDSLALKLGEEKRITDSFSKLPYYWYELSSMILEAGSEELTKPETIRFLLQQLKEIRKAKIEAGISQLDARPMGLHHIGCAELHSIKPFFIAVANQINDYSHSLSSARSRHANARTAPFSSPSSSASPSSRS